MKKLLTKEIFVDIFSNPILRQKLDKIILNFFGLENTKIKEKEKVDSADKIIEFNFLINTEFILKIVVVDKQKLFENSKKFYLNLSYRKVKKYYALLIPCFWEIYIPYTFKNKKNKATIYLISSLFYASTIEEIKNILNKIKDFTVEEKKNIIKIIKEKNNLYKDK